MTVAARHKKSRMLGALLPPLFLLFGAKFSLNAQDGQPPPDPQKRITAPMRDRAVMFRIITRVLEKDDTEAWNSDTYKVMLPGRPVGLRIVGENVAVSVQFTLYQRRGSGVLLFAHVQIFTGTSDGGVQYRTMMQTLPIDFGEQIFFFPLGSEDADDEARIEIQLEMSRYDGTSVSGDSSETSLATPPESPTGAVAD
ncbi:MAG: hypothetical protein LBH50_02080 [Spirochaetaceae bacterium]|nr:hypothetical protein [Spirochaetaceae bacterium]